MTLLVKSTLMPNSFGKLKGMVSPTRLKIWRLPRLRIKRTKK